MNMFSGANGAKAAELEATKEIDRKMKNLVVSLEMAARVAAGAIAPRAAAQQTSEPTSVVKAGR